MSGGLGDTRTTVQENDIPTKMPIPIFTVLKLKMVFCNFFLKCYFIPYFKRKIK